MGGRILPPTAENGRTFFLHRGRLATGEPPTTIQPETNSFNVLQLKVSIRTRTRLYRIRTSITVSSSPSSSLVECRLGGDIPGGPRRQDGHRRHGPDLAAVVATMVQEDQAATDKQYSARLAEGAREFRSMRFMHASLIASRPLPRQKDRFMGNSGRMQPFHAILSVVATAKVCRGADSSCAQ